MEVIVTNEEKLQEIIEKCLKGYQITPIPEAKSEKEYLHSINALAKFLDCSPVTAQKLKNSGKIRFKQFGRKCIFDAAEVLEDLARQKPVKKSNTK